MPRLGHSAGSASAGQLQLRLGRMESAVRDILKGLGEDVQREGLLDTPKRVAKALLDVTSGYASDPTSVIGSALFNEPIVATGSSGIVLVRDIDFASTSEHTLLPFHGRCHIAYLPSAGVVLGLSKLARLTKLYSKRLQAQDRLGRDIAQALCKTLACSGVAVVLQARHLSSPGPLTPPEHTTAALSGCFEPGSFHLMELQELLGVSDLANPSASSQLPLPSGPLGFLGASDDGRSSSDVAAPLTPDTSEKDTDGDSDDVAMAADADPVESMEAAVQQLVQEIGGNTSSLELKGTARRYIMSLLESTSGYHQKLPQPSQQQQQGSEGCSPSSPAQPADCGMDGLDSDSSRSASCCSSAASTTTCMQSGSPLHLHHTTVHFRSLCEHHMLPFYGKVHIAYLTGPAAGPEAAEQAPLSVRDLERVVAMFTQRLQVQERITHQVADAVWTLLQGATAGRQQQQLPQQGGEGAAAAPGVAVVVDAGHMCMVARGVESHGGSTTSVAVRGAGLEAAPELRFAVLREARRVAMRC